MRRDVPLILFGVPYRLAWAQLLLFTCDVGMRVRPMCQPSRHIALLLLVGVGLPACARYTARPAYSYRISIGDRGISVPLPPPSLRDQPKQAVDVQGQVTGDKLAQGTELQLVDNRGEAKTRVPVDAQTGRFSLSIEVDLSDTCLELWLVTPEGDDGAQRSLFSTRITLDDEVEVVVDCAQ